MLKVVLFIKLKKNLRLLKWKVFLVTIQLEFLPRAEIPSVISPMVHYPAPSCKILTSKNSLICLEIILLLEFPICSHNIHGLVLPLLHQEESPLPPTVTSCNVFCQCHVMGNCFWLYNKEEMCLSSIFYILFIILSIFGHITYMKFSKKQSFCKIWKNRFQEWMVLSKLSSPSYR